MSDTRIGKVLVNLCNLNEAKQIKNGNGTVMLEGDNIGATVFTNVSPNRDNPKRMSISISNLSRNTTTFSGDPIGEQDREDWENTAKEDSVKQLQPLIDALDEKITKILQKHIGKSAKLES